MKVKILKTAAGARYSVQEGEIREFSDELAKEMVKAGIAAPIQAKRKATKKAAEKRG